MSKDFIFKLSAVIFCLLSVFSSASAQEDRIEAYFFYSNGCPHCRAEEAFLDKIEGKYPQMELKRYEISSAENRDLYNQIGKKYGAPEQFLSVTSIPLTIIGEKYFLGYRDDQTTGQEIESHIGHLLGKEDPYCASPSPAKSFNFFGKEFSIPENLSLIGMGSVLGLANGINPCTISVLVMLLAYLLTSTSFKQAIRSGIIFSLCVFLFYFLLMVGVYKSFCFFQESLVSYVDPMKMGLGAVFLLMGIWMAKDFFFLKPGQKVSFAIPQFAHPIIKKFISYSSLPAVILLALFSSLVELPCAFALPLSYSAILAEKAISPYPYFFLYNVFFVLPLFVVIAVVGFGFSRAENVEQWREKFKKNARLISGILLILLGLAFIFRFF